MKDNRGHPPTPPIFVKIMGGEGIDVPVCRKDRLEIRNVMFKITVDFPLPSAKKAILTHFEGFEGSDAEIVKFVRSIKEHIHLYSHPKTLRPEIGKSIKCSSQSSFDTEWRGIFQNSPISIFPRKSCYTFLALSNMKVHIQSIYIYNIHIPPPPLLL